MEENLDFPTDSAVQALQRVARILVAIALRSMDPLDGTISLAQFRLLLTLTEHGCMPSSQAAAALGIGASSITRLADRLDASGHIRRGIDPRNRSVVTLQATPAGRSLVEHVMRRRHDEFTRILDAMTPGDRAAAVGLLERFADAAGERYAHPATGPLPL